ncbi:hypothetical protein FN846DRAFT_456297 [Sphaerosporella brunnea]|uniref:DUF676 domain-containing protein n=1 Tax=Sphaerosporella brunnea TaxID=1250544 RepID=A0A5J5EFM5_9PEZI|nr:hypothetical protein FN846DRAFT_456297 [Sphaerosporella brunnea]
MSIDEITAAQSARPRSEAATVAVAGRDVTVNVRVRDEGFTVLQEGISPIADIVFIHGLQGHPRETWVYSAATDKTSQEDVNKKPALFRNIFRRAPKVKSIKGSSPVQSAADIFWPQDLLAPDFPNVRILTYGYDSHVSRFFSGPANQNNINQHGRGLLHALEAIRRENARLPLIFIVHNLGGIILKEALRRSKGAREEDSDLLDVYRSTYAIAFLGTPHRGSNAAEWGLMARNVAVAVGFDANDKILRDLRVDSGTLETLREEFNRMLQDKAFSVYTFQEARGFKGFRGLSGKIVDDASSGLDSGGERKDFINANHVEMTRFNGKMDDGYVKVAAVLSRYLNGIVTQNKKVARADVGRQHGLEIGM